MLDINDVALYFIQKDEARVLFNKTLISRNGRTFYEGNARLNKYLHLAQNIYIAKTGTPLMDTDFYAYDNGAVIPEIQENYPIILKRSYAPSSFSFNDDQIHFLDMFYIVFQNASVDELIQLSHEDPAWIERQQYYFKQDQKMDVEAYVDIYKKRYASIIKLMDKVMV